MPQLAIIADDLTGALDAAAPFAGVPGGVVVATLGAALGAALALRPGVVSVSTRSREIGVDDPVPVRSRLGPTAARAIVPDTVTPEDMARALGAADPEAVLVGARGLASALATRLAIGPVQADQLLTPVCIAVGSRDPITLAQVAALRAARPDLREIIGPVAPPDARPAPVTLLRMAEAEMSPEAAARRFAEGAAPWLRAARSAVLTGGATAEACLDAIGCDLLRVQGEILPGLPVSEVDGLTVVTKSGGFGAQDALARLAGQPARAEA